MNPTQVPIPERMKRFPLYHGYPIHYTVWIKADGTPDFKVMNEPRRKEAFGKNLCHLCGQKLAPMIADNPCCFIGGPLCVEAHRFVDGPMHLECARYAALACPFLSSPCGQYHSRIPVVDKVGGSIVEYSNVQNTRPARMALVAATEYRVKRNQTIYASGGPHASNPNHPGQLCCHVGDYLWVDWNIMPASKKEGVACGK